MNDAEKSMLESTGGRKNRLYKPYSYMPSPRVWFLDLSALKTGVNFSLESGTVFERTMGAYKRIFRINFK